jgi:putative oxidoreductase
MFIALLIVRLIVGLGIAAHGAQKLFGWFGGYGLAGTGGFFEGLGFRPGRIFALLAGLGEFVAGLLIALGLFGAIGPALLVIVMVTAIGSVHWSKGFWQANGGWELNSMYVAGALALAFAGFGAYSLDHVFNLDVLGTSTERWITIGAGFIIGLLNLALRRPAPAQQPQ